MITKPANVDSTRPKLRYQDEHQNYHFDGTSDVTVECNQETNQLNHIPSLGISAGLLYVNGVPITNTGRIHVPAYQVEHRPGEGKRGMIELKSEYGQ